MQTHEDGCSLCNSWETVAALHESDCPWRLAVEWVEANPSGDTSDGSYVFKPAPTTEPCPMCGHGASEHAPPSKDAYGCMVDGCRCGISAPWSVGLAAAIQECDREVHACRAAGTHEERNHPWPMPCRVCHQNTARPDPSPGPHIGWKA